MDLFEKYTGMAELAYANNNYAAALDFTNKAAKVLRQIIKLEGKNSQQTSQKT